MISALNHTLNVNPVLYFPLAVSNDDDPSEARAPDGAEDPTQGDSALGRVSKGGACGNKATWADNAAVIVAHVLWQRRGGIGPSR